jgi:hypothetical protein
MALQMQQALAAHLAHFCQFDGLQTFFPRFESFYIVEGRFLVLVGPFVPQFLICL